MKYLIPLIITLSFFSCTEKCDQGTPDPNCICTMEYAPVCGCDGVTYSNDCAAGCAGISEYTEGEC